MAKIVATEVRRVKSGKAPTIQLNTPVEERRERRMMKVAAA